MKNIRKNGGANPFMRGLHATMVRDFFFLPAFFGQYEVWKDKWASDEDTRIIQHTKTFAAGAISLFTAWLIIYPLDLVKTHIHAVNSMTP